MKWVIKISVSIFAFCLLFLSTFLWFEVFHVPASPPMPKITYRIALAVRPSSVMSDVMATTTWFANKISENSYGKAEAIFKIFVWDYSFTGFGSGLEAQRKADFIAAFPDAGDCDYFVFECDAVLAFPSQNVVYLYTHELTARNWSNAYWMSHELMHCIIPYAEPDGMVCDTNHEIPMCEVNERMGYGGVDCSGKAHPDAGTKYHMGWLTPSDVITVTGSGTYELFPIESGSGIRALRFAHPRIGLKVGAFDQTNEPFWIYVYYRVPTADEGSVGFKQEVEFAYVTHTWGTDSVLSWMLYMQGATGAAYGDKGLTAGMSYKFEYANDGYGVTVIIDSNDTDSAFVSFVFP